MSYQPRMTCAWPPPLLQMIELYTGRLALIWPLTVVQSEEFIVKYGQKQGKSKRAAEAPKRMRAPRGKLKKAARRSV